MFTKQLAETISRYVPMELDELENIITKNKNSEFGDYAFPCFDLAKLMKMAPNRIAAELAGKMEFPDYLDSCKAEGPYLNFYINRKYFNSSVLERIELQGEKYGSSYSGVGKTCFIEHTSINPNASPHIGRARNAIIGDFASRLLKFEGYDVKVHYFVNDIGKQISMLVLGAEELDEVKFGGLLRLYVDINNKVKENPDLEQKVFDLLYQLENGNEDVKQRFRNIVDICIKGQTEILNEIGIHYDYFDYESEYVFDKTLEEIVKKLNERGLVFEDEVGRFVVNLESYGLNPLVVTRADKTSLYPLRDIAYTIWKMGNNADRNIIVLGQDQEEYFRQIAAVMKELGYESPEAIHYSFVLLVEGKMSTRQGTVVLLEDFMREAVNKADEGIIAREGKSDIERAKKIAYGAVKYSMEKTSNGRNVLFDWDNALSFDGDTGPYVLYSYVRINSILKKSGIDEMDLSKPVDYSLLTSEYENTLISELSNFPEIIRKAQKDFSPHIVTHYVFELAKQFSAFYRECSVINAENNEVKYARTRLILNVKQVIENVFYILGIDTVEYM